MFKSKVILSNWNAYAEINLNHTSKHIQALPSIWLKSFYSIQHAWNLFPFEPLLLTMIPENSWYSNEKWISCDHVSLIYFSPWITWRFPFICLPVYVTFSVLHGVLEQWIRRKVFLLGIITWSKTLNHTEATVKIWC